jgi:hypothetical protein
LSAAYSSDTRRDSVALGPRAARGFAEASMAGDQREISKREQIHIVPPMRRRVQIARLVARRWITHFARVSKTQGEAS